MAFTAAVSLVVVYGGLCAPFSRLEQNWIRDSLADLLGAEHTMPSPIAPVAWTGTGPIKLTALTLEDGVKVDLRLRSDDIAVPVRVLMDNRQLADIEVDDQWETYRIWLTRSGSELALVQPVSYAAAVHVSSIKATNVARSSEGILKGWAIRRPTPFQRAPGLPTSLVLLVGFSAVAGLLLARPKTISRNATGLRRFSVSVASAAIGLAAARVLFAVMGLRLIFTPATAAIVLCLPWVGLVGWSRLRSLGVASLGAVLTSTWFRTTVAVGLFGALWIATLSVFTLGGYDGDMRGVARFGWKFALPPVLEGVSEQSRAGYDGQFYAVLATDPLLRDPATIRGLDNPTYRATRMLIPALAWLSAGGSAVLAPTAYVAWCWLLGLAGPVVVLLWIRESRLSPFLFVLLACSSGLVVSLTRATPDAAASTLMLLALLTAQRSRSVICATVCGTLAVMARETSLLVIPAVAWPHFRAGKWRRAVVIIVVPLAFLWAWRTYLDSVIDGKFVSPIQNFGLPFAWLPEKIDRLVGAGWQNGGTEYFGIAWVLVLVAAAGSYLVWRRQLTPALLAFLAFALLATVLTILVYNSVHAYARVLIVVPFVAVLVASEEKLAWRRWLLIIGILLAAVQGVLLLDSQIALARKELRRNPLSSDPALHPTDIRVDDRAVKVRERPTIAPSERAEIRTTAAKSQLTLGVYVGNVEVYRGDRRLLALGLNDFITIPLRRDSEPLFVVNETVYGARLAPLKTPRGEPIATGGLSLVPVVLGGVGPDGVPRVRDLELCSRWHRKQRVVVKLVPGRGASGTRAWAKLTLRPERPITLRDPIRALFDQPTAGVLLLEPEVEPPVIRTKIGRRLATDDLWSTVPLLGLDEIQSATSDRSSIEIALGSNQVWASVIVVNPYDRPLGVRLLVATNAGRVMDREFQLAAADVASFGSAFAPPVQHIEVVADAGSSDPPVVLASVVDEATGAVRLYSSSDAIRNGNGS